MSHVAEKVKKALTGGEAEDRATSRIEDVTSKVPSTTFLGLALGALGIGVACQVTGRKSLGNFIAQLAPTILIMGLYNKTVKQHGH